MRLLYYNLYLCKNGVRTDYPLEKIVDEIIMKHPSEKLCNLSSGDYSLTKMRPPDLEREARNRSFWISKYREKKPLTGTKGTDEVESIDKDVMETTNCLLIPSKNFLAMEYSHLGCRITGLVEYFNDFLYNEVDSTSSDRWHLEYNKITEKSSFNVIEQSENVKRIDVDFLANGYATDFLINQNSEAKTVMEKLFESSLETAKYIDGNIATFTIKKGRFSKKMDSQDVVKLLKTIYAANDNIVSIKVVFDNPATGKKNDFVDLKHDGQLQDVLLENDNSDGFEFLAREISDFYYGDGGRKGLSFSNRFEKKPIDGNSVIFRMKKDEKK